MHIYDKAFSILDKKIAKEECMHYKYRSSSSS